MQTASSFTAIVLSPDSDSAFNKIYGLTVLERTFHALERGGVTTIILPQESSARLAKVTGKAGWKVGFRFIETLEEMPENNISGLLVVAEPLVLDTKIVQEFLQSRPNAESVLVSANEQLAFFPPASVSAVNAGFKAAGFNLTEWLKAAKQQAVPVKSIDFPGQLCSPVASPAEKKAVKKALIRSLTKPTDGWVSRNLNRPVSTSISRVLAYTPITPNQFTIVTGMIGLATGVFAAMGGYWNFLIAGTLFHLTSVLDGVDGELARLKFKSSPFGQWLDTLVDNLSYVAGLTGIIIGIYRTGATDAVKIAAGLAVLFVVLALGSLYLYLLRFKSGGTLLNVKYSFQDGESWFDKTMQVAAAFGKRDLFALIFFMLAVIGQFPMTLGYVAIMAFFVFAFSLQAHFKAASERSMVSGR